MTSATTATHHITVLIPAHGVTLEGELVIPATPKGIIIFAEGTGSSRLSPRDRAMAVALQDDGYATLLLDLLTSQEDALDAATGQLRFDIGLLAPRLAAAADWLQSEPLTRHLPIGCFGSDSGTAAALAAAALRPGVVMAIVSRGGRPNLAEPYLGRVNTPTLLLVGEYDTPVVAMNRAALHLLGGPKELVVIDRAGHLFEEPGALAEVTQLALRWFERYVVGAAARASVAAETEAEDGAAEIC